MYVYYICIIILWKNVVFFKKNIEILQNKNENSNVIKIKKFKITYLIYNF